MDNLTWKKEMRNSLKKAKGNAKTLVRILYKQQPVHPEEVEKTGKPVKECEIDNISDASRQKQSRL